MAKKINKGVVILLDALGIRNATIEEAKNFADFVDNKTAFYKEKVKSLKVYDGEVNSLVIFKDNKFSMNTFADTILITIKLSDDEIEDMNLMANKVFMGVSALVSIFMLDGFKAGFLIRGAISIGEFIQTPRVVLGPAITDAAAWYENVSWFGCVATPNCSRWMNSYWDRESTVSGFVHYENVPIKNGSIMPLRCVNWPLPLTFLYEEDEEIKKHKYVTPYRWYQQYIKNIRVPINSEMIHHNSDKFFEHVATLYPPAFLSLEDREKKNKHLPVSNQSN